jgi:hypothetical protein
MAMTIPSSMRNFLPRLTHGSGRRMTLDRTRLLLSLKKKSPERQLLNEEHVEALLGKTKTNLVLERTRSEKRKFSNPEENYTVKINHTKTEFWLRSKDSRPITPKQLQIFKRKPWRTRIDWIGPVYKLSGTVGPKAFVCPVPYSLLIRPAWEPEGETPDNLTSLTGKLREWKLKEVPDEWKYGSGHWYTEPCIDCEQSVYALHRELNSLPNKALVKSASFEIMPMVVSAASHTPSDPYYGSHQWNMRQIHAEDAWDISRGSGVKVCILDYGFDLNHPDLAPRFQNDKGIQLDDPTQNGTGDPTSWNGHGTACAGILGASMDNRDARGNPVGVAGLASDCEIVPLALVKGTSREVADGIDHAVKINAQIVLISHQSAGWEQERIIEETIEHAHSKGLLICAAAGNDGGPIAYPAKHRRVIACGATDSRDNLYVHSNGGPSLCVVAPGVGITTTAPQRNGDGGGNYFLGSKTGTSYAAPHVAGLAALLMSAYPMLKGRPDSVRAIIEESAEPLKRPPSPYQIARNPDRSVKYPLTNKQRNDETGFGLVNVQQAFAIAARDYGNPAPMA